MKFLTPLFFFLFIAAAGTSIIFYKEAKDANQKTEMIEINPVVLEKKLEAPPPPWMLNQIKKDLSSYASGITKEMLDKVFKGEQIEKYSLVRFIIENGHITYARDEKIPEREFQELLGCLKKLNEHAPLPNVDFIVSFEGGFDKNPGIGPCLVFAKKLEFNNLILIPDIKALVGYANLRKIIPKASEKYAWDKKVARSFWRGATSGGYASLMAWDHLTRSKLVLLSLNHPNEINARFSRVIQCDPEVPLLMKAKGMLSENVSMSAHLKYKYLIDVDGNSCSFERYFWSLLSNSLVLKQVTSNIQWYYGGLEPYKHFVPVKEDLSDLLQQIEWAKTHDIEARLIAEEATQFVKDNLSPEDTILYLYLLLKEYARLGR